MADEKELDNQEEQGEESSENTDLNSDAISPDGVQDYDLTGSRHVVHGTLPTLALVDDRTASLFASELSHVFTTSIEVIAESSGIWKFLEYKNSLENPGCLNFMHFEALRGHGLIAIDMKLLFRLLEWLFGGGNKIKGHVDTANRTRFSSIEERVIRRIVHLFCRAMESAWRPVIPLNVRHLRIETKPNNVIISDPGDWVVGTTYKVSIGNDVGYIKVAMPMSLLEPHKKRLSSGRYEQKPERDEQWRNALTESFKHVDVTMIAELGRANISLGEMLNLKVGDVIRLHQPPEEPIFVNINNLPKYYGRPTVTHGNLAVRLERLAESKK